MVKSKYLLVLGLLIATAQPAKSCDLWREAKKFAIQNSGPIGMAAIVGIAAYYYLQAEEDTNEPAVKHNFKSILPKIQREYRIKEGKNYKRVIQLPVIIEADEDLEDLD